MRQEAAVLRVLHENAARNRVPCSLHLDGVVREENEQCHPNSIVQYDWTRILPRFAWSSGGSPPPPVNADALPASLGAPHSRHLLIGADILYCDVRIC